MTCVEVILIQQRHASALERSRVNDRAAAPFPMHLGHWGKRLTASMSVTRKVPVVAVTVAPDGRDNWTSLMSTAVAPTANFSRQNDYIYNTVSIYADSRLTLSGISLGSSMSMLVLIPNRITR